MQIYFVRHAQDDDNFIGGWSDIDLTEEGKQQANILARYFIKNNSIVNIKTVVTSDLRRAVNTIQPTADALNISLIKDSAWRGLNNGKISGLLSSEAKQKYPNTYLYDLDMDEHYPDGESPREFYNRVKDSFAKLLNYVTDTKENIIVLTHGSNINILYSLLKGEIWDNKKKTRSILATSIIEVDVDNNGQAKLKRTFFC
jgi:broad specificity phosphatase PhoE